jgi:hypothetical protein
MTWLTVTECLGYKWPVGYVNCVCRNHNPSFPHSWLIAGFIASLTRRVTHVEQELFILQESICLSFKRAYISSSLLHAMYLFQTIKLSFRNSWNFYGFSIFEQLRKTPKEFHSYKKIGKGCKCLMNIALRLKLKSSLRGFCCRHHDLVNRYGVFGLQMTSRIC